MFTKTLRIYLILSYLYNTFCSHLPFIEKEPSPPKLDTLPHDLIRTIFTYLDAHNLARIGQCSKKIHLFAKEDFQWNRLSLEFVGKLVKKENLISHYVIGLKFKEIIKKEDLYEKYVNVFAKMVGRDKWKGDYVFFFCDITDSLSEGAYPRLQHSFGCIGKVMIFDSYCEKIFTISSVVDPIFKTKRNEGFVLVVDDELLKIHRIFMRRLNGVEEYKVKTYYSVYKENKIGSYNLKSFNCISSDTGYELFKAS